MELKASNFFMLTIGSVVGVLAILTSEYATALIGYVVLVVGLMIATTVAMNEGRPYYMIGNKTKMFLAISLLVWLLAVVAAAALAVL